MRHPSRWRLTAGIGVVTGALVLSVSGVAAPAFAQTGPVSNVPATGTPELEYGTNVSAQEINVLKQCGNTIYAGGTFSAITQNGNTYTRTNLFSFSATAPYTVTSWNPDVNGNVQSLAFDGGNCSDIYVGGSFSAIGGTPVRDIAEVSTTTGAVDTAFAHNANGPVDAMNVYGSNLLAGGGFTYINGSVKGQQYYASLSLSNGLADGYLNLNISGNYRYSGVVANTTRVYAAQVSHSGARVMVEGDFTSVGGQPRQQVFQMWLKSPSHKALVTGWHANLFNTHCASNEPFYAKTAAWSPDDNTVYVGTTGNHVYDWNDTFPLPPPCDMALAFSASEQSVGTKWINPTGCDSLLSVISDDYAVYFAGHERWTNNWYGCNTDGGHGAIQDYGMEGVSPSNGQVLLQSNGQPEYTMSRANGEYMMLTSAGLWIGSTNRFGDNSCNGVSNLSGICFLPYS
jgi:hypothetical protein